MTQSKLALSGLLDYSPHRAGLVSYADPICITDWVVEGDTQNHALRTGDLVKIFQSVTDGDILWRGKVDLYQAMVDRMNAFNQIAGTLPAPANWDQMFLDHRAARLEKSNGAVIFGSLDTYYSQDTEGFCGFIIRSFGKQNWQELLFVENGDDLTVFKNVKDGALAWQGRLDLNSKSGQRLGPLDLWTTDSMPTTIQKDDWERFVLTRCPAIIEPA